MTASLKPRTVLRRLFLDHPDTVGETYSQHLVFAARFGLVMIRGGLGALVHALVPGWCQTTGSDTVARLNRIAAEKRRGTVTPAPTMQTLDWVI